MDQNTLNLDPDPEFWANLDPDPEFWLSLDLVPGPDLDLETGLCYKFLTKIIINNFRRKKKIFFQTTV